MLGGMTGLPTSAWDKRDSDKRSPSKPEPPLAGEWTALNQPVDHVFTHFRLTLTVERLRVTDARPEGAGQWWPLARIGEAGLPTLFAKVARAVMEGGDD